MSRRRAERRRSGKYRDRTSRLVAALLCLAVLAIAYLFFFDAVMTALDNFFLPVPLGS